MKKTPEQKLGDLLCLKKLYVYLQIEFDALG